MTFGAKWAMSLLPNIEPVTLFLMVFGAVFGWKSFCIVYVYVLAEILFFGIETWNINYLYIWLIPALIGWGLRRCHNPVIWAAVSGLFGLFFGALCAPVDFLIGDWGYVFSKWISGIPFDVLHCVGNFVMALLLFVPLKKLILNLHQRTLR